MESILAAIKSIFSKIWSFITNLFKGNDNSDDDNDDDILEKIDPSGQTYVCYYGCPNGKKAGTLRTKEKAVRK